jgi:hypothetical protein
MSDSKPTIDVRLGLTVRGRAYVRVIGLCRRLGIFTSRQAGRLAGEAFRNHGRIRVAHKPWRRLSRRQASQILTSRRGGGLGRVIGGKEHMRN